MGMRKSFERFRLLVPTRLEGMETQYCGFWKRGVLSVPTRLEGMETSFPHSSSSSASGPDPT